MVIFNSYVKLPEGTLVRFPQLMWSNLRKNSSGRSPRNFAVVPAFPAVPARPSAAVREKPRDANGSDRKNCGWMSTVLNMYIYIMVSKCDLLGFNGNYDGI